jgi:uncharacterized protein (DUF302 family)
MPIKQIRVERFSIVSAKPFDDILETIHAAIGHPDLAQMQHEVALATTYSEMESIIDKAVGPTGLMQFMHLDMGMYLSKGRPGATPRSIRMLVGNPLIMRRMAEHVPDTASYAPVTILIDERPDGVHLSYDRMASFLAPYGSDAASAVAADLDRKVEALLSAAAL